jgi:aromatic-L-amino-acid/L-tryptophan decarboxylase
VEDFSRLELSEAEFRALMGQATDRIAAYVRALPDRPSRDLDGVGGRLDALDEPMPEFGRPVGEVLDRLFGLAVPGGYAAAGPGYLAYIPGGGLLTSAVAELIARSVNGYTGLWVGAPGLVQLEVTAVRWLCDLVGLGADAGGFLTTGGSLANLTAVVTARRTRLPEDFLRGTIYTSDQAHHSVVKAAVLAGFPQANVRLIPADEHQRVRVEPMRAAIEADLAQGWMPTMIVGHAGTTNTGAIDPMDELADLAHSKGLWLHVDGAYGGAFLLTDWGKAALRGIERADSVTLDPHKGLFLPYGTGALVVARSEDLRSAHRMSADYLSDQVREPRQVDFCDLSPELSREPRGVRLWLPLQLAGASAFRAALNEKRGLALWATEALRATEGIEVLGDPQLTVVAFRAKALDDAGNRALLAAVVARGRVALSGTVVDGRFVLRICVLCFRTHAERVAMAIEDIQAELALSLRNLSEGRPEQPHR